MKFFTSTLLICFFMLVKDSHGRDLSVDDVISECKDFCDELINKKLPVSKCTDAHAAGSKYVSRANASKYF